MSKATPETTPPAKSAGRPKASEVEARTRELIDIAGCLFLRHGYNGLSLEAIAREARVAVRTIYVKFGGKAGLLKAVLEARRARFFPVGKMDVDQRPMREVIDEFAGHFYDMLCEPDAMALQRVVIAEAGSNPELAEAFYEAGPRATREMLERYFARADIQAQLRPDAPYALLGAHLIACINGDPVLRFLFPDLQPSRDEARHLLSERLELFYRSIF
ncbi:TetR/AcrR family transcriptional regulator [Massilia yuzhufengensis]|uniref:Transcriptional regulator, TetR family n=1 Tax=Massilia yuzhufengensis TaxID=1164594 RepID=A0A1I1I2G9_9BURK|nr:TetR/AcrR family transcriptional regulator [Massilia yuzhufengensis]SFC30507.1 transcriptional regulator, TetR family [Massilia yuzhufengensis]